MSTVALTRTVVVVGTRPRSTAAQALGAVRPGEAMAMFVLGVEPTRAQRRLTDEALLIAADRRFVLTVELVAAPSARRQRLHEGDEVRVLARPKEARRWGLAAAPALSAPGA
jgi:hypothetical protein